MVKTYDYPEAIRIINTFMVNSGIREYCQKTCKGRCCVACRIKKKRIPCDKKIPCAMFICINMSMVCDTAMGEDWTRAWDKSAEKVRRDVDYALELGGIGYKGSSYYADYGYRYYADLHIELPEIKPANVAELRGYIQHLAKNNISVRGDIFLCLQTIKEMEKTDNNGG